VNPEITDDFGLVSGPPGVNNYGGASFGSAANYASLPPPQHAPSSGFGGGGYGSLPPPQQQQQQQQQQALSYGKGGKKDWTQAQAAVTNVSATQKSAASEQFCYNVKQPVTVRKNQSALVPFIEVTLSGKLVAIYNRVRTRLSFPLVCVFWLSVLIQNVRDKNPFTALLFDNNTGCPLPVGPTTVYRDSIYVGEAVLPSLKPAERSVLPFNVEVRLEFQSLPL